MSTLRSGILRSDDSNNLKKTTLQQFFRFNKKGIKLETSPHSQMSPDTSCNLIFGMHVYLMELHILSDERSRSSFKFKDQLVLKILEKRTQAASLVHVPKRLLSWSLQPLLSRSLTLQNQHWLLSKPIPPPPPAVVVSTKADVLSDVQVPPTYAVTAMFPQPLKSRFHQQL
ncbi:hypothetical protein DPMN_010928 [Dreissena polymorpha]|uniref:Uncharacterized protein n=1 Tax=Dreissena polymorpha TaxID=45954 RepID=A0A9D4N332_DREPO|nr:hypothetical protein DPMN_010928 [Dreissena polymorpha]